MGGLKTGNICISVQCLHSLHSLTVIVKWDSKQQFLLGVDAPLYTPMTFCSHMTGNDTGWQVWSSFQASGDFFLQKCDSQTSASTLKFCFSSVNPKLVNGKRAGLCNSLEGEVMKVLA